LLEANYPGVLTLLSPLPALHQYCLEPCGSVDDLEALGFEEGGRTIPAKRLTAILGVRLDSVSLNAIVPTVTGTHHHLPTDWSDKMSVCQPGHFLPVGKLRG